MKTSAKLINRVLSFFFYKFQVVILNIDFRYSMSQAYLAWFRGERVVQADYEHRAWRAERQLNLIRFYRHQAKELENLTSLY